jgi:acetyl esterase/lipase
MDVRENLSSMTKLDRRALLKSTAWLAAGSAVAGWSDLAAAAAPAADPLAFVHPELRAGAARMMGVPLNFTFTDAMLPRIRTAAASLTRPMLPDVPVSERRIAGAKGAPEVTLYIINARPGTSRPAILHTHGGGFIIGSAKSDVGSLQPLAKALDCVIVSVEYRLAPETRWQGSLEDNYSGLQWLHGHAAELGADPARIAVMGESAGGGHAALLAIAARDRGEVPLVAQILIYPMLDDRTGSSIKRPAHMGTLIWTPNSNVFGWRSFLGQQPGTPAVPSAAVPARVAKLAGLPATFIGVGAIDLFCDEDVDYARRLADAGVPTELHVVPGAFHGFDGAAPEASIVKQFNAAKLNALRRAFRLPMAG